MQDWEGVSNKVPKRRSSKGITQYNFKVKSPFILIADLEATNSENAKIAPTPSTNVKRIHRINSYAIYLHHVCFNHSLNADLVLPRFAHALIL